MSPIRVTWARTVGALRSQATAILAIALFLAATATLTVFNLRTAEGGRLMLPAIWSSSLSPLLPVLAAVLGMEVWSGERHTGRIDALLSIAVRERDFVLGKFLGVLTVLMATVLFSWLSTVSVVGVLAGESTSGMGIVSWLPALLAIGVQGTLWCAVAVAASAFTSRPATAAVVTVLLLVALPRGLWRALMTWSVSGRTLLGEFPVDVQTIDWASGMLSVSSMLGYLVLTALMLLVTTKRVTGLRFVGQGARCLRWSTGLVMVLTLVLSVLTVALASRYELAVEMAIGGREPLSDRTRQTLADTSGDVVITTLLPRKDARYRELGQLLRQFRRVSSSLGGARIELRHVDPRWDLGAAERLARRGIDGDSVVFERGRRQAVLPIGEGLSERRCATAIQRVSSPAQGRTIYWTVGHGESRHDDYGAFGMSDIARELVQAGYRNSTLDLAADGAMPADCSMIVVAGAKQDFSRTEIGRIEAYLRGGGRLLALLNSPQMGGVVSLLPAWGIRTAVLPRAGLKTLSGSEVIVRDFSPHVVSVALQGSQLVLEHPVALSPSAVAATGVGVERVAFAPLASVGESAVAAAIERGAAVGSDLALRPTRIVVVGDATLAMNGPLLARANANRDFFLNCVAFLSGLDITGGESTETGIFRFGIDRKRQLWLWGILALALPLALWVILTAVMVYRRRRS